MSEIDGTSVVQELIATGRNLELRGSKLRAWVEAELSRLDTQRKAEGAAFKPEQERQLPELAAQREELLRQIRVLEASAAITSGRIGSFENLVEGIKDSPVQVDSEYKRALPKLSI